MTDYRFHSVGQDADGSIVLNIIVGKSERIREVPITEVQALDAMTSLARGFRRKALMRRD